MHPDDVKAIDAYTEIVRREAAKDAEISRLQEQVETLRKERDALQKIADSKVVSYRDLYTVRADAAEAERDRLRDRLQASIVAIDDWLHQYAGEFCDEKYVAETIQRIRDNGGTLAYIADVQEANRAALQKDMNTDYVEALFITQDKTQRLRCNVCGRFIALKDFQTGARCRLVTPDSHVSRETYDITCKEHS